MILSMIPWLCNEFVSLRENSLYTHITENLQRLQVAQICRAHRGQRTWLSSLLSEVVGQFRWCPRIDMSSGLPIFRWTSNEDEELTMLPFHLKNSPKSATRYDKCQAGQTQIERWHGVFPIYIYVFLNVCQTNHLTHVGRLLIVL